MQVVVSTSLQTCSSRSTPAPGTGPGWPEILRICNVAWLMLVPSCLFQLDEKALKFRGVCVGINHRWCEPVGDGSRVLACIFLNAAITLMDRNADLVHLFAVNRHRLNTLGDEGFCDIVASRTGDLHLVAPLDPQLPSQLDWNFDERFRNKLDIHRVIFGPVVVMLGEPVGGADDVEALVWRAILVRRRGELLDHRIVGLARV